MFYLNILILLTVVSYFFVKAVISKISLKKEEELKNLKSEYYNLSQKALKLKEENYALEKKVTQILGLYNISKDMSRKLDENKIFRIFKERINDYVKVGNCNFLGKEADLSRYEGYINLPLIINNEIAGYLIASNVAEDNKYQFQILAQQFLIMVKRAFLYKNVHELAIMDGLTQVFSRRHVLERFEEELKRSRKFKHNLSFLMVDIDKFKNFNDKYGHLVGDAILREVSRSIKDNVRQIDFVGRYGGEELSIALPETDKEQALLAAERIRQAIEARDIKVYDEELKVTVSVGISTFPDDADSSGLLIEAADKALYLAKKGGRNRVCAYRRK
ncbi:MAG: GGDEF domain-containing protein [Candidatus Omnitrophota bacterium]|jgi:diguanylate cyclase (GGDEF)-like protein